MHKHHLKKIRNIKKNKIFINGECIWSGNILTIPRNGQTLILKLMCSLQLKSSLNTNFVDKKVKAFILNHHWF